MTSARKLEHLSKIFETLGLFLPGSPYYSTLSSLPPPDRTNPTDTTTFITQTAIQSSLPILEEMLSIQENKDTKQAAEELERRRRRLDAPPREQLKRQITCEISAASKVNSKKTSVCIPISDTVPLQVPELYREIINHPDTPDDLRRSMESRLLYFYYNYLVATPGVNSSSELKQSLRKQVDELVQGMVLIEVPEILAWTLFIDGFDCENLGKQYVSILTLSLIAVLIYTS